MNEKIGDKIQVSVIFKNGKISPFSFIWQGWKYNVEKINYFWIKKEGQNTYYYFSVDADSNTYELCFHRESLSWFLTKVYLGV